MLEVHADTEVRALAELPPRAQLRAQLQLLGGEGGEPTRLVQLFALHEAGAPIDESEVLDVCLPLPLGAQLYRRPIYLCVDTPVSSEAAFVRLLVGCALHASLFPVEALALEAQLHDRGVLQGVAASHDSLVDVCVDLAQKRKHLHPSASSVDAASLVSIASACVRPLLSGAAPIGACPLAHGALQVGGTPRSAAGGVSPRDSEEETDDESAEGEDFGASNSARLPSRKRAAARPRGYQGYSDDANEESEDECEEGGEEEPECEDEEAECDDDDDDAAIDLSDHEVAFDDSVDPIK